MFVCSKSNFKGNCLFILSILNVLYLASKDDLKDLVFNIYFNQEGKLIKQFWCLPAKVALLTGAILSIYLYLKCHSFRVEKQSYSIISLSVRSAVIYKIVMAFYHHLLIIIIPFSLFFFSLNTCSMIFMICYLCKLSSLFEYFWTNWPRKEFMDLLIFDEAQIITAISFKMPSQA